MIFLGEETPMKDSLGDIDGRDLRLSDQYKHVLDVTEVSYCEDTRSYKARFKRVIENCSEVPLQKVFATLLMCSIPTDIQLARKHYRRNPISLENLKFRVWDGNGRSLKTCVIDCEPYLLELIIFLEDTNTGECYSLDQGEQGTIEYQVEVPDSVWGPLSLRHVRWHCDEVQVKLDFPSGLVSLQGESLGVDERWKSFDPPLSRKVGRSHLWKDLGQPIKSYTERGRDFFEWNTTTATQGAFYRFSWVFSDDRYEKFVEDIRRREEMPPLMSKSASREHMRANSKDFIERGAVHASPDYRSIFWFGEWYYFTPVQARCVDLLWRNWEAGLSGLGGDFLLEEAESTSSKLSAVFRRNEAWKKGVIFSPQRGVYSLRVPGDLEQGGLEKNELMTPVCLPKRDIVNR